jgi:hypothetical protein
MWIDADWAVASNAKIAKGRRELKKQVLLHPFSGDRAGLENNW